MYIYRRKKPPTWRFSFSLLDLSLNVIQGILGSSVFNHFEMEVGPGAVPGGADGADALGGGNALPDPDVNPGEMGVPGAQAIAMVNQDTVAIAAIPTSLDDSAVGIGIDAVSLRGGNIQSVMETPLSGDGMDAPPITAGDSFAVDDTVVYSTAAGDGGLGANLH